MRKSRASKIYEITKLEKKTFSLIWKFNFVKINEFQVKCGMKKGAMCLLVFEKKECLKE